MSRLPTLLAACTLPLLFTACGPCKAKVAKDAGSLQEIADSILDACLGSPGAVVALSTPDQGEAVAAAGESDVAGAVAMQPDDLFHVASITKTYTAAVVLQLYEEGALSLDDTIDGWVADIPSGDTITIRHLLNHSSGIPDYAIDEDALAAAGDLADVVWSPQDLVDVALEQEPLFDPGRKTSYSNTNYILLGMVIEQETGVGYGEAVRARLLDPLGLEYTWVEGCEELPKELVHGYSPEGDDVSDDIHPSRTWAAGAVVATADDLRRWGQALYLDGEVVSSDTLALMQSENNGGWPIQFGLGVMIITQPPPLQTLVGHTGGHLAGASTALFVHEETGTVGVALLNAYDADAWGLAKTSMKAAVKHELGDW